MPYDSMDPNRRSAPRRSQGRAGESRGINQGPVTSQGRRPAQARGGSANQYRNTHGYRGVGGRTSSYNLRQHNINFNERKGGVGRILSNPRAIVALVIVIFLIVICVLGISSCVRGCSKQEEPAPTSGDERIAGGLTPEMTDLLTTELDREALMAQIAAGADKIEDERLIQLALNEPEAVKLVAGLLSEETDRSAKPYGTDAAKGSYPKLYNWDLRWGYTTFGDGLLALTGSGPSSMAITYIGLTGKTDYTPADFAKLATEGAGTDATFGIAATFVEKQLKSLGLSFEEFTPDGDDLTAVIESGTVVLVPLKVGTFGDQAHWIVVVGENLDGSVNIIDPTSSANTAHPWDPATVASAAQDFYAVSLKKADDAEEGTDTSAGTEADATKTDQTAAATTTTTN